MPKQTINDYDITKLLGSKIQLSFIKRKSFSDEYLKLREQCWDSASKNHGNNLWNGEVYTIENIHTVNDCSNVEIQMGVCEYKDIMLKIKEGPAGIVQKFGQESLTKDAIVAVLPYTTDNKFLFGVVSSKTIQKNGSLDTIGGTLNRDEKKVNTIDDVKRYMIMEMREEIGLNFDENNLFLHSLNYFHSDGRYRFIYLCRLPEDSSYYEGISVNEELSKIRLMSKDELIHYSGPSTNRIPFCQKNIEEILKDFSEFELERV